MPATSRSTRSEGHAPWPSPARGPSNTFSNTQLNQAVVRPPQYRSHPYLRPSDQVPPPQELRGPFPSLNYNPDLSTPPTMLSQLPFTPSHDFLADTRAPGNYYQAPVYNVGAGSTIFHTDFPLLPAQAAAPVYNASTDPTGFSIDFDNFSLPASSAAYHFPSTIYSHDNTHYPEPRLGPAPFSSEFDPSIENLIFQDRHPRPLPGRRHGPQPQAVDFDPGPSLPNDYVSHRQVQDSFFHPPASRDAPVPTTFIPPDTSNSTSPPTGNMTSIPPGTSSSTSQPTGNTSIPFNKSSSTLQPSGNTVTSIPPDKSSSTSQPTGNGPNGPNQESNLPILDEARLKSECKDLALRYFCSERPLRDQVADKAWLESVVDDMALRYGGSNADAWKKLNKSKLVEQPAKSMLYDVTYVFKRIAFPIIHCFYDLLEPLEHRVDIATVWTPKVNHVLQEWRYTDTTIRLSQSDESVRVPFGHPALIITLLLSLWYQPSSNRPLHHYLSEGNFPLDKLLAYCATILNWALTNLKQGGQVKFEADIFSTTYNNALTRIQQLRTERPGNVESVQFLKLVNNLPARGAEFAATLNL